jgi:hypothetical protein
MAELDLHKPQDVNAIITQTLGVSLELVSDLIVQTSAFESFDKEREYFWNTQFMALTSDISRFVELTTLLSQIITTKLKIPLPEFKTSHIQLLFVMKAITHAQQKKDSVILEDLIKYELKDNLTQWKIHLIPSTKRLLSL